MKLDENAPAGKLVANVQPWELVDWPEQHRRNMYRSWAQYFAAERQNLAARIYFNKCIDEHAGDDWQALYLRSKFHRSIALAGEALEDSKRAVAVSETTDTAVNIELSDALYDLNRFEEHKMLLHDNMAKCVGHSKVPFERRVSLVNSNFNDSVGDSLGPFFLKNSSQLRPYYEELIKSREPPDMRPIWKILRERHECDTQSVLEIKKDMISPLQAARRQRKAKIYYQHYFNRNWVDIAFMQQLRHNPNVTLNKYFKSGQERANYLNCNFNRVKTFTQMLHCRSPVYNETKENIDDWQKNDAFHKANMYRIQYQTRRNMLSILSTIRSIRKQKDTLRLRKYVSDVMGHYNTIKTLRLMPWKTEFMNEVYNHLALSLCQGFRLPKQKLSPYDNDAMCHLLGMPSLKPTEPIEVVFGDRSTYVYDDSGPQFEATKAYKRSKDRLEKRLYFATLPIERSYLLYELADSHMGQHHLVQCLVYAKRAIEEARKCNSIIWEFLATMLQAKSHAVLCKYERQSEVLDAAYKLAKDLKSPKLCTFIELCRMLNRDYMTLRKMSQLVASKRLRYKMSNRSSGITPSQFSPD
ncbi:r-cup, partial [Drosophila busckii]